MTVTGQSWAVIVVELAVVDVVVVEVVWSWAGKEQLLVFTTETADRDNHCGDALMMVVG